MIAQMAGVDIPLVPMKHAYIITEPMNVQGLPNVRDLDFSIYFRIQGAAIQIGGYEPNPIVLKSVSCTLRITRETRKFVGIKKFTDTIYVLLNLRDIFLFLSRRTFSPLACTS